MYRNHRTCSSRQNGNDAGHSQQQANVTSNKMSELHVATNHRGYPYATNGKTQSSANSANNTALNKQRPDYSHLPMPNSGVNYWVNDAGQKQQQVNVMSNKMSELQISGNGKTHRLAQSPAANNTALKKRPDYSHLPAPVMPNYWVNHWVDQHYRYAYKYPIYCHTNQSIYHGQPCCSTCPYFILKPDGEWHRVPYGEWERYTSPSIDDKSLTGTYYSCYPHLEVNSASTRNERLNIYNHQPNSDPSTGRTDRHAPLVSPSTVNSVHRTSGGVDRRYVDKRYYTPIKSVSSNASNSAYHSVPQARLNPYKKANALCDDGDSDDGQIKDYSVRDAIVPYNVDSTVTNNDINNTDDVSVSDSYDESDDDGSDDDESYDDESDDDSSYSDSD